MSHVYFKFKSSRNHETITFDGLHISLGDLKKAIIQQKKLQKSMDNFRFQIINAQTQEEYMNDEELIPKNTSVLVARIPISKQPKPWEQQHQNLPRPESNGPKAVCNNISNFDQFFHPCIVSRTSDSIRSSVRPGLFAQRWAVWCVSDLQPMTLEKLKQTADLHTAHASEEDKVKAMMSQSTMEYDSSKYVKPNLPTGPPPAFYRCRRCNQAGHYIHECPNKNDPNLPPVEVRLKRPTGIPISFLTRVEDGDQTGALLTHTGHYVVPTIDKEAFAIGKREKPPFAPDSPERKRESRHIPSELLCELCKDLLTDAVVAPCCGNSFCDECVRNALLETEEHECPHCHETDVSPDKLIANKFLRTAVQNFLNESGYTKFKKNSQVTEPQHSASPPVQAQQTPPVAKPVQDVKSPDIHRSTPPPVSHESQPPSQVKEEIHSSQPAPTTNYPTAYQQNRPPPQKQRRPQNAPPQAGPQSGYTRGPRQKYPSQPPTAQTTGDPQYPPAGGPPGAPQSGPVVRASRPPPPGPTYPPQQRPPPVHSMEHPPAPVPQGGPPPPYMHGPPVPHGPPVVGPPIPHHIPPGPRGPPPPMYRQPPPPEQIVMGPRPPMDVRIGVMPPSLPGGPPAPGPFPGPARPPGIPLTEEQFYKTKAKILQQELEEKSVSQMQDDFLKELEEYAKEQKKRQEQKELKKSLGLSPSKSRSRSRSRTRSKSPKTRRKSLSRSRTKSRTRSRTRSPRPRSRTPSRYRSRSLSRSPAPKKARSPRKKRFSRSPLSRSPSPRRPPPGKYRSRSRSPYGRRPLSPRSYYDTHGRSGSPSYRHFSPSYPFPPGYYDSPDRYGSRYSPDRYRGYPQYPPSPSRYYEDFYRYDRPVDERYDRPPPPFDPRYPDPRYEDYMREMYNAGYASSRSDSRGPPHPEWDRERERSHRSNKPPESKKRTRSRTRSKERERERVKDGREKELRAKKEKDYAKGTEKARLSKERKEEKTDEKYRDSKEREKNKMRKKEKHSKTPEKKEKEKPTPSDAEAKKVKKVKKVSKVAEAEVKSGSESPVKKVKKETEEDASAQTKPKKRKQKTEQPDEPPVKQIKSEAEETKPEKKKKKSKTKTTATVESQNDKGATINKTSVGKGDKKIKPEKSVFERLGAVSSTEDEFIQEKGNHSVDPTEKKTTAREVESKDVYPCSE
ncbi:LOW QUALITY PROTEIN: E3 ubiquitin-protein ligase RBBP6-like [Lingula anatina]|uniref:LOW QUALITY PROTEIN: E3 ubiquitin-protein ligase RBBP6-like n=1 Tax=Lingula anatina TaxID=7574 RepID=A0A1S3HAB7_LINAN|nr:LOW QUALITY PROTEIN: E3 ubiquitin-protein ligase RBBP6-like [Lingula anatina]|eukprot:XP_013382953.1 LOW QUALITY PROTEIN: E3 ubiquitin-protein ligase RBBP6-like [Lingula anatina]